MTIKIACEKATDYGCSAEATIVGTRVPRGVESAVNLPLVLVRRAIEQLSNSRRGWYEGAKRSEVYLTRLNSASWHGHREVSCGSVRHRIL